MGNLVIIRPGPVTGYELTKANNTRLGYCTYTGRGRWDVGEGWTIIGHCKAPYITVECKRWAFVLEYSGDTSVRAHGIYWQFIHEPTSHNPEWAL